jgi:hypothetical protein
MQSLDFNNHCRITVSEMSRRSQLEISSWFNDWIAGGKENLDKLKTVTAISTQVILHSRIALYMDGEKMPDGLYMMEEGAVQTLPLTEECLNELPASLVAWLIDAAGTENSLILANFLAGTRAVVRNGQRTHARLSASGLLNKPPTP